MFKTFLKATVPAMVLAFAAFQAPAASANTIILDSGSMDHQMVVNIAGIGNVYAAPMHFVATDNGAPTNLLAWCVDVYHHISLGNYSPDLVYTDTVAHTTDFDGHALDAGDQHKIGLLANYGQAVFNDLNAVDRYLKLSAVQSAIWQVASNRNVTSSNSAFDLLVDNLSTNPTANFGPYNLVNDHYTLITPVQQYNNTQAFVFAVPEPGTWALMIGGFGLMGAALRRHRSLAAGAVA